MISQDNISSLEELIRQRQGPVTLAYTFTKNGIFQYTEKVSVHRDEVEISSMLQTNCDVMETQSVTMHRDFACDMAHAILQHFGRDE